MRPLMADAFAAVSREFDVPMEDLCGDRKCRDIAYARFAAWLIGYDLIGYSFPQIARHTRHNHTSVLYGVRRARDQLKIDSAFAERYRRAHDAINHPEVPTFKTRRKP